jgi:hypothetical protein
MQFFHKTQHLHPRNATETTATHIETSSPTMGRFDRVPMAVGGRSGRLAEENRVSVKEALEQIGARACKLDSSVPESSTSARPTASAISAPGSRCRSAHRSPASHCATGRFNRRLQGSPRKLPGRLPAGSGSKIGTLPFQTSAVLGMGRQLSASAKAGCQALWQRH